MTTRFSRRTPIVLAASFVALVLNASTLCLAQATAPRTTRFMGTLTQVKPDMLDEWFDLQKNEVVPALKKAGVSSRTVSRSALGNTYEFLSISPLENYALLDSPSPFTRALGAEGAARLFAKLRKCINGSRTYVFTRNDDLSILPDPSSPPPVSVTIRRRITPGKTQDYENYIRTELLPVYKKAKAEGKIAGYTVGSRGLGAVLGELTTTILYSKFADLEGGNVLTRMLGQEAAQKVTVKATGLSTVVETVARRRVADLSF